MSCWRLMASTARSNRNRRQLPSAASICARNAAIRCVDGCSRARAPGGPMAATASTPRRPGSATAATVGSAERVPSRSTSARSAASKRSLPPGGRMDPEEQRLRGDTDLDRRPGRRQQIHPPPGGYGALRGGSAGQRGTLDRRPHRRADASPADPQPTRPGPSAHRPHLGKADVVATQSSETATRRTKEGGARVGSRADSFRCQNIHQRRAAACRRRRATLPANDPVPMHAHPYARDTTVGGPGRDTTPVCGVST